MTTQTPRQRFQRYTSLRQQISRLQKQLDELIPEIRADLLSGTRFESQTSELILKHSQKVTYPTREFYQQFGLQALLQCAEISNKAVDLLTRNQTLDLDQLNHIKQTSPRTPAVHLQAKPTHAPQQEEK